MTPREIAREATSRIAYRANMKRTITNDVFLIIENDDRLLRLYRAAVRRSGEGTVNRSIGRGVKEAYNLTNADERENDPSSKLIKSHQIFL